MQNTLKNYKLGLTETWKGKALLFWLYGINLLFAYLLALPVAMMFSGAMEHTVAADRLLKAFDLTILATIISEYGGGISLGRMMGTFGFLYFLTNIFFAGGIISYLSNGSPFQLRRFFSESATYFGRFFRLFLISFLFFLGIAITAMALSKIAGIITESAATEHASVILMAVRLLIIGILLALTNMIFDYAKFSVVYHDHKKMFQSVKSAVHFIRSNASTALSLYFLLVLTALMVMVIYYWFESYIDVDSGWMVLVFFVWSQIYVIVRIWIRLAFYTGQYRYYETEMAGKAEPDASVPDEDNSGENAIGMK